MFKKKFLFLFSFILLISLAAYAIPLTKNTAINFYPLALAIDLIKQFHVSDITTESLIRAALKGMANSLDEYSEYLSPEEYEDLQIDADGKFAGIGVELTIKNQELTVISALAGSISEKKGLKPNDLIIKINNESTKNISLDAAIAKIRGKVGTSISLTILRNDLILTLELKREIVKINSLKKKMIIDHQIGYLELIKFQDQTKDEISLALKELSKKGVQSLILDLRNNPGGVLTGAVDVADLFLKKGKPIVNTKGKDPSQNIRYTALKTDAYEDIPMIVLINKGSASASEVLAGCLKDNERATLIGTKTFGKGSVQTLLPLEKYGGIRLTTAKYYTPSGIDIDQKGITPTIELADSFAEDIPLENTKSQIIQISSDKINDPCLKKAIEFLE